QNGWYSAQWIFVTPAASRRSDNEPILEIVKEKPASVDVFPNPSTGGWVNIHISGLETGAIYTLNIFDINGKNIFIKNIGTNSRLKYNLVPGYYVLQLIGKKTSISRKFIVQ
ncbi:MAG: T9SS type A sorting domain-containing protein, partial [Gloeobacteraceae cyanobacterium ES-bin-316]|nr:T9SS type A sorting domain-containing protein [Ferruginibacter sp.]